MTGDALAHVLDEIYTPESADDLDGNAQLGRTMIFGWDLTPDETDQLAAALRDHATTARKAVENKRRGRQLPPRAMPPYPPFDRNGAR